MAISRHELSTVFRRLSQALERLGEEDVLKLVDESYDIEIKLSRKRHKEGGMPLQEAEMSTLVTKLTACSTRTEAQAFLDANCATRKALEPIARGLDIPISKHDKVEALRDKIIEATVGARIRSQAIQGGTA